MFLSRLHLDARDARVRAVLGDVAALHRLVMTAFPDGPLPDARARHGVLWRLEPEAARSTVVLLVQSRTAPDWTRLRPGLLAGAAETKEIDGALGAVRAGARLRFRLVANPTRRVIETRLGSDGAPRPGRRVPVRTEEELLHWLIRKGAEGGFSVGPDAAAAARSVVVRPLGDATGRRGADRDGRITLRGVGFDGVLAVEDAARLRQALESGVGSGKAFGFGLLSIGPA